MNYSGNCFENCSYGCVAPLGLAYSHLEGGCRREKGGPLSSLPNFGVSGTNRLHPFSPTPERDTKGKILCVFQGIGKFILLLGFLYFFVCSLDVLSSAFQLAGGMDGRDKDLG